jgi:hypothetical protein
MGKYFDLFPKLIYDIAGDRSGSYDIATNLFIRLGILNNIKNSTVLYYPYLIQDGDTPEMIADKYYGDPQYHWVVLMMNDVVDPFYDWPLSYEKFNKYLVGKYGSIQASQLLIVRYEQQIDRRDSNSGSVTTSKVTIDSTAYAALPASTVNTYNLTDGSTVTETITRNIIYAFDDEMAKNEAKRAIKLLKKEHLETIRNNFESLISLVPTNTPTVLNEV